jgi:hypothetical protein
LKIIERIFARVGRLLKVEAETKRATEAERANLLSIFGAIVLNGLSTLPLGRFSARDY